MRVFLVRPSVCRGSLHANFSSASHATRSVTERDSLRIAAESELLALCNRRHFDEMDRRFAELKKQGVKPNKFSYITMLRAAELQRNPDRALQLFEELSRNSVPTAKAYKHVVNTLATARRCAEATQLLREFFLKRSSEIVEKSREEIVAMAARLVNRIDAHETEQAYLNRVEDILEMLRRYNVPFSSSLWAVSLKALARAKLHAVGEPAGVEPLELVNVTIAQAKHHGCEFDGMLLEAGTTVLFEALQHAAAVKFFESNVGVVLEARKNLSTAEAQEEWNRCFRLAVDSVIHFSPFDDALKYFDKYIVEVGLAPTPETFRWLYHALLNDDRATHTRKARGFDELKQLLNKYRVAGMHSGTVSLYAALCVGVLGKPWREALELAEAEYTQRTGGVKLSQVELTACFGLVMAQLVKERNAAAVLEMWDEVERLKLTPTSDIFGATLLMCTEKDPRRIRIQESLAALSASQGPDPRLMSVMLNYEGKFGSADAAVRLFRTIVKRAVGSVRVSQKLLNAFLHALYISEDYDSKHIGDFIAWAEDGIGVAPNPVSYNILLLKLAKEHASLASLAQVYTTMKDKGVVPNAATFRIMFHGLDRTSRKDEEEREKVAPFIGFLISDWEKINGLSNKDSRADNALLRALRFRSMHHNDVFLKVYKFMRNSEDPTRWATSETYDIVIRYFIAQGRLQKAYTEFRHALSAIEEKRGKGLPAPGIWRHTVEYLVGFLLGEGKTVMADEVIAFAKQKGFFIGNLTIVGKDVDD